MRWFIEVSRLGEDTPIDKYCLEAKQWQAALQEARKRRGDTGPLSKFSIELLEQGYRAVDPNQKIRYVVNKAPADAPLSQAPAASESAPPPGSFPSPAKVPSVQSVSPVILNAPEPVPSTDPMAAPPPHSDPLASGPKTDPMAALPPESHPPRTDPLPHPPPRPASGAGAKPEDKVPPVGAGSPSSITQPMTTPTAATASSTPARPSAQAPAAGQMTQRSMEAAREPSYQLLRKREEEPTEKVPIVYREFAYAIAPETERASIEVLLWLRFREISASLEGRTHKKYIQLAVFDHVFEKKPLRAPVATMMWKDWRGEPVLQFGGGPSLPTASNAPPAVSVMPPVVAPAPAHQVSMVVAPPSTLATTQPAPAPASTTVPAAPLTQPMGEAAPPAAETHSVRVVSQPFPPAPSSPTSAPPPAPPLAPAPSTPPVSAAPWPASADSAAPPAAALAAPPAATASTSAALPSATSSASAAPSAPASAAPSAPAPPPVAIAPASAVPPTTPSVSPPAAVQIQAPAHPDPTGPTLPIRRRAAEELIGELFELMHDLHFIPDMMSGVDFVLGILTRTLPSEIVLIHVFDINTRQFVVVRALAPSPDAVVLHRTPDQDPLLKRVMRGTRSRANANAASDDTYRGGRWNLIGTVPESAILGPVQLAGRYLGAIELANPLGGGPYTEHEAHALDYICEQLAEFLAARPIIVDADVVLGKR